MTTLDVSALAEDAFIRHYGVRGMKWGKRNPRNENYSDQQIKRDTQVYGKSGAKRVNKQLNDGDSISVARGNEKTRRDRVMGKNKYVRQGGKVAGAVGGVVVANVGLTALAKSATSKIGQDIAGKILGPSGGSSLRLVGELANNPAVRITASAGAAKVATMFAGDAAVSVNMRANGYDPNRK